MVENPPLATAQFIQRSIQRSLRELPALPDAVIRVVDETNLAEPSIQKIERYVSSDQALTSKVLRVVNSAYYGLSGQVSSVSQAVMILGLAQVRNVVLSVGAISLFEIKGPRRQDTLKKFWLHSFSTAVATQVIGNKKRFDRLSLETVFIAGLLHDVGRLFLFANFTNSYDQMIQRANSTGLAVEMIEWSLLGIGHAEIGQQMAEYWKLPGNISQIIGGHEGPFTDTEDPLLLCVHVADSLSKHLYYADNTKIPFSIHPAAEAWMGFSPAEFEDVVTSINLQITESAAWLQQMAA